MNHRFSILEHPSDLGIEAHGATMAEAFASAAAGMVSVICDPATIRTVEWKNVSIAADDPSQLCVRWLSEILYLYDGKGFLPAEIEITELSSTRLAARVGGEICDPERHATRQDVKAVTYHQLDIHQNAAETIIKVYLDI
jgi:SHS2 domain-containing protein